MAYESSAARAAVGWLEKQVLLNSADADY